MTFKAHACEQSKIFVKFWPAVQCDSLCIKNRNSSTGAQVIATSQMYRGMYPKCIVKCIFRCHHKQPLRGSKPVKGLLGNQDLGMSSKEPIKNTIKNYPKLSGDEVKRANQKYYQKLFK